MKEQIIDVINTLIQSNKKDVVLHPVQVRIL